MNHISKTHKKFSERLNNPRVIDCPEDFFGENYEAVLNFWLILDELSKEQLRVINERHWAFCKKNYSEWNKAADLVWDSSKEVVDAKYVNNAGLAAENVTKTWAAYRITKELIAMHKILEDHQQPLTFFEMFLEVL